MFFLFSFLLLLLVVVVVVVVVVMKMENGNPKCHLSNILCLGKRSTSLQRNADSIQPDVIEHYGSISMKETMPSS